MADILDNLKAARMPDQSGRRPPCASLLDRAILEIEMLRSEVSMPSDEEMDAAIPDLVSSRREPIDGSCSVTHFVTHRLRTDPELLKSLTKL